MQTLLLLTKTRDIIKNDFITYLCIFSQSCLEIRAEETQDASQTSIVLQRKKESAIVSENIALSCDDLCMFRIMWKRLWQRVAKDSVLKVC